MLLAEAGIAFVLAEPGPEPESSGVPSELAIARALAAGLAAALGEEGFRVAVDRPFSTEPTAMSVWSARVAMYSSYEIIWTLSRPTPQTTRRREVSWVPHCRANVSPATSIARECSRARVMGRRKS